MTSVPNTYCVCLDARARWKSGSPNLLISLKCTSQLLVIQARWIWVLYLVISPQTREMFENSLLQENLEMHFWIKFKPSTSYIVSKQKIPHSTVFMEVIFFNCYVTQIWSKYPCRYRRYAAAVRVSRHNRPSVFASSYSVHFISIASQVIVISDSIVLFSSALASVEARPCPFQWLGILARREGLQCQL